MGVFIFEDSTVTMKVNDGVDILYNGNPVKEMVMIGDGNKDMTVFQYGPIKWNLIVRNELYGIRFRDLESEFVKSFKGIERFPVNEDWRIEAKYEVYNPPKIINVPNVLGQIDEEPSPGAIIFTKDNQTYRLMLLMQAINYGLSLQMEQAVKKLMAAEDFYTLKKLIQMEM